MSCGDYLEQLTYLIFLKMSDEYARPPYKRQTGIPAGYAFSNTPAERLSPQKTSKTARLPK